MAARWTLRFLEQAGICTSSAKHKDRCSDPFCPSPSPGPGLSGGPVAPRRRGLARVGILQAASFEAWKLENINHKRARTKTTGQDGNSETQWST